MILLDAATPRLDYRQRLSLRHRPCSSFIARHQPNAACFGTKAGILCFDRHGNLLPEQQERVILHFAISRIPLGCNPIDIYIYIHTL